MAYAASFVVKSFVLPHSSSVASGLDATSIAVAVLVGTCAKLVKEQSPPTYYLYVGFACFFWWRVLANVRPLRVILKGASSSWMQVVSTLGMLELAVLGYFERSAWTLGFVILGVIWPYATATHRFRANPENRNLAAAWAIGCLATSVFTLLPVEKGENLAVMCVSFPNRNN